MKFPTKDFKHLRKHLGANIRKIRLAKHLPLEALSAQSGLSVLYLYRLEKGKKMPPLDVIFCIAHNLDVNTEQLFKNIA